MFDIVLYYNHKVKVGHSKHVKIVKHVLIVGDIYFIDNVLRFEKNDFFGGWTDLSKTTINEESIRIVNEEINAEDIKDNLTESIINDVKFTMSQN